MDKKDMRVVVDGVSVNHEDLIVLDDVNFDVAGGEFISVVGESGCGKTTLLNAIGGFKEFTGSISKPERTGFVFQDNAVFPWMTVEENIAFGLEDKSKLEHYLEMVDLEEKRDRFPFELSGGQVQRTAFARTLASDPDLILMDEPYGALDPHTRERMQEWLLDIWKKHEKTILFVTHSIEEALILSDRILVLKDKCIVKDHKVKMKRPRQKTKKHFSNHMEEIIKRIYR